MLISCARKYCLIRLDKLIAPKLIFYKNLKTYKMVERDDKFELNTPYSSRGLNVMRQNDFG